MQVVGVPQTFTNEGLQWMIKGNYSHQWYQDLAGMRKYEDLERIPQKYANQPKILAGVAAPAQNNNRVNLSHPAESESFIQTQQSSPLVFHPDRTLHTSPEPVPPVLPRLDFASGSSLELRATPPSTATSPISLHQSGAPDWNSERGDAT